MEELKILEQDYQRSIQDILKHLESFSRAFAGFLTVWIIFNPLFDILLVFWGKPPRQMGAIILGDASFLFIVYVALNAQKKILTQVAEYNAHISTRRFIERLEEDSQLWEKENAS